MTTSAARWRSLLVHGLRRGDRRARVCGCVTHMKTDDGSGADVRSQPPRDGKFMRSASAEKCGAADAAARPGWVRPPSEHGAARAHAGRAAPRPPSRLLRVTRVAGPPRPRGLYFLLAQLIRAMRVRFAETSVSRSTPSPPGPVRCTVRTSAVVRGGIRVTARVPPHPPPPPPPLL